MTVQNPQTLSAPDVTHLSIAEIRQVFASISNDKLPLHWLNGWLLAVIDQPSSFLITDGDFVPGIEQAKRLNDGIARMMTGEPLAYLVGSQGFWGRDFAVNAHTLIPRADTEILIETVLKLYHDDKAASTPKILDLGTGTGCIAITLAKELPSSQVWAVDFSDEALQVARANAKSLAADNCTLLQSDWYTAVTERFDIIVSNPPYIDKTDAHLADLRHEPISALVADDAGLSDIMTIVTGAGAHLNAGGALLIEHGYDQGVAVRKIFEDAGFTQVATIQDYGGNDRMTMGFLLK